MLKPQALESWTLLNKLNPRLSSQAHCEAAGVAEERLGPTYIQLRPYAIPPPWMLALEIAERIK